MMLRRQSPSILMLSLGILVLLFPSIVLSRPPKNLDLTNEKQQIQAINLRLTKRNETNLQDASKLLKTKLSNANSLPSSSNATTTVDQKQVKESSILQKSASSQVPIRVNSKTGKAIARMQGKRQVGDEEPSNPAHSRRNEDPWFLDSPPYPLQPYRFQYNVKGKNGQTEQYRQEIGDGKFLTGSYGYVLPDGIYRHVDYVADDRGFRAYIRTSEPGTANQNPADVVIDSNPVPVIPGITYARPGENLNSPTFPPLNPYDYSTLRSSENLVRRPLGSIVGTPVRNFTSYAFPSTSSLPSAGSSTLWPPLTPVSPSVTTSGGSFGPLPVRSPLPDTNLSLPETTWSGSQVTTDESLFRRIKLGRESVGQQPQQNLTENFKPLRPTFSLSSTMNNQRSGPSVLSYDRPFSNQNTLSELGHPKLSYDYVTDHVVANPNYWNRLASERARQITNLGLLNPSSFNSYQLGPLSPPTLPSVVGGTQYGSLAPLNKHTNRQVITGSSSSEISGDSYHRSQHEHLDPDFNKVVVTKEHRSGFKNGTGRDYELRDDRPEVDTNSALLPPPPPIFPPKPQTKGGVKGGPVIRDRDYQFNSPQQRQSEYTSSDQQQIPAAGLPVRDPADEQQQQVTVAPAANSRSSPPPSPVFSVPIDQQVEPESQSRELTKTSAPMQQQDDYLPATKSPTFGPTGVKGADWSVKQPLRDQVKAPPPPPSPPVRTIRMPEDYRSSMMMNDLRSMQQVIGLPQPPRLHRFTRPAVDLNEERIQVNLDIADQIVNSRLNHVDALLSGRSRSGELPHRPPPPPPPSPAIPISPPNFLSLHPAPPNHLADFQPIGSAGQSASSIQPSIALRIAEPPQVQKPAKSSITKRVLSDNGPPTNTATLSSPLHANNTQPNKPSTPKKRTTTTSGSLSKLSNISDDSRGGFSLFESLAGPSNESTSFEAQRLVKAAKLQAEKVSELEKFQQRLRTQQLLLEQFKNPNNKTSFLLKLQSQPHQGRVNSELNLHVKYDDINENTNATDPQPRHTLHKLEPQVNNRDYFRSRRQNEAENSTRVPTSSTTTTTTTTSTSTTAKPPVVLSTTANPTTTWKKLPEPIETIDMKRRNQANPLGKMNATTLKLLSDLAQQIQHWPSVIQTLNKTTTNQQAKPNQVLADLNQPSGNKTRKNPELERTILEKSVPNNTINLDFINSVTALSVDQLNPFAMASVNPGIRRSSESRLQPYKLETSGFTPTASTSLSTSGPVVGIAISNARYTSSPELLAVAGHSAIHDYGNPNLEKASSTPTGGWAGNHRFGGSIPGASPAPYMMTGSDGSSNPYKTANITSTSDIHNGETNLHLGRVMHSRNMRDGFTISDNEIEVGQRKFFEVVSNTRQPNEVSQFQAFKGEYF